LSAENSRGSARKTSIASAPMSTIYLAVTKQATLASITTSISSNEPLFPTDSGRMNTDTPRDRRRIWMERTEGIVNPNSYGFHSLRAGGATAAAAAAGVQERLIKQHRRNWKSEAVRLRVYLRPGMKERTRVSSVLGH
jgi:integrase